MARIKAHQVIPAVFVALATAAPAAATVEILNQAQSGPGTSAVGLSAATSNPSGGGKVSTKPASGPLTNSRSSVVASVHLPAGLGDGSGGDDGGGGDGGGGDGGGGDDGGRSGHGAPRQWQARNTPAMRSPQGGHSVVGGHGGTKDGSFTGSAVSEQFGTVQAMVTVRGGKITSVSASGPMGNQMSAAINQQALPILKSETLQAQSANVNLVSGATVTSQAYVQSLQSALTQAHL